METKTITIAIVVVLLGVAAAVAGFVAEATKVTKSELTVVDYEYDPECEYPSSPAMGLAIAAVVFLVIARAIITSATGGCCSCCQTVPNLPKFARVCIIISWIVSSIAIVLFCAGATLSNKKDAAMEVDGTYYCYTVRPGIFSGAGIMGLVGMLLAVTYYLNYVSAKSGNASEVEVELEAPPIKDAQIANGKKPSVLRNQK